MPAIMELELAALALLLEMTSTQCLPQCGSPQSSLPP